MFILFLLAATSPAIGLEEAAFQNWLQKLDATKQQPSAVSVHTAGGKLFFTAAALENPRGLSWEVLPSLSLPAFNEQFQRRSRAKERLVSFLPYFAPGGVRVAAQWVKDDSIAFQVRLGLSPDEYQKFFDEQTKEGFRPASVTGYLEGRSTRLAVILNKATGQWAAAHACTATELRKFLADPIRAGYRPVSLSAYWDGKEPRFNVILESDVRTGGMEVDLDAETLKKALAQREKENALVEGIWGYSTPRGARYLYYWKSGPKGVKLPIQGTAVPELAALDEAVLQFMKEREFEAGTLALSREGKMLYSRGYGYLDRENTKPVPPDTPFRLASVTKPITAALVLDLVRRGELRLEDKAFALIGFRDAVDPRWNTITIQMLLEHRGGWDRNEKPLYDPMFQEMLIRKTLRLDRVPSTRDIIRFMSRRKLDFDPGSKMVYSNFGYCVLGRVIEKKTGKVYHEAVKDFLAPLGITSVGLARTRPAQRDPREPFYYDPRIVPDVIRGSGRVAYPDGGFHVEAQDANGGLILSAPDLLKFMNAYWLDGHPRKNNDSQWTFYGGMAGTFTMARQRPDGIHISVLFNQRFTPEGLKNEAIKDLLDKAIDSIKKWP
jgi:CubicO group peptidase (beta-lactamase class C family)